jgi:hypothetical protein
VNRAQLARLGRQSGMFLLVVILVYIGWRWLNPTSSAICVFDSPDGKYRCAVFYANGYLSRMAGRYEYEAGLFSGSWPHRELSGERAKWTYDSVASWDFRVTWEEGAVELNFCTGYGDQRATFTSRDQGGKQQWTQATPTK